MLTLKTAIKTEKARKIIRNAEKDLLQARVKSINSILGDNTKQRELSRSKLASIVSSSIMDKCQQFIDKVSELRFLKIKERQVNKFNRLLLTKQGNITWFSAVTPCKQAIPGQRALVLRQPVPLPLKQVVPKQSALSPKEISLSIHMQVVPRQSAPTPREIALFPLRQVPPGQRALVPRQPAPLRQVLPRQRVLMPRHPVASPQAVCTFSKGNSAGPPQTGSAQAVSTNSHGR